MIKGKELRLGNLVKDRGEKVIRIDFLDHIQDGYDTKFGQLVFFDGKEVHPMTEYSDFANPIPLTNEILEKTGFEDLSTVNIWQDKLRLKGFPFTFVFTKTYNELRLHPENFSDNLNIAFIINGGIKSVHQLQNLYFALTGKELDIKL